MTSDYINLTSLGEIYGVPAADVGRWLKGLSLRQPEGRPTHQAISEGYAKEKLSAFGSSWLWHREKVCELLDGMQYRRGGSWDDVEEHEDFLIIRGV